MSKFSALIFFVFVSFFFNNLSFSQEILILQGGKAGVFQETIRGIQSAVQSPIKIVDVADVKQRLPLCNYKITVALGSRAAAAMKNNYCKGSNYIYALVLSSSEIGVDNYDQFVGIHPTPSFDGAMEAVSQQKNSVKNIGVFYSKSSKKFLEPLKKSAAKYKINIFSERAESSSEIEGFLSTKLKKIDTFFILPDPIILDENILLFLIKKLKEKNIFIVAPYKSLLNYNVDMAYAFDFAEMGEDIGLLISDILQGKIEGPQLIFIKGSVFTK